MTRAVLATILSLGLSGAAFAGDGGISVSGTGTASAPPDCAQITLSVNNTHAEAATAYKAVKANTETLNKRLADAGIDPKYISTVDFNFYQQYDDKRKPTGWRVDHRLSVKVKNVNDVGKVADTAVSDGQVHIIQLSYELENREAVMAKARDLAIANAKAKGEQLAKGFGTKLGPVQSVTEQESHRSLYSTRLASADQAPGGAGVQAGELSVSVELIVTFGVGDKTFGHKK